MIVHLIDLLDMQRRLQNHIRESSGRLRIPEMDDQGVSDYIAENVLALTDELHEALNHVGWKSWAKERGIIDRKAYLAEVVDAFFFWMNLVNVTGASADEIEKIYIEKHARNMARYANGREGYSMREGKCANCGEDFGDIATRTGIDPKLLPLWAVLTRDGRAMQCCSKRCAGDFNG
jgi:dimeric dUTPase (all-alpha-NTP-PPase superfamily)